MSFMLPLAEAGAEETAGEVASSAESSEGRTAEFNNETNKAKYPTVTKKDPLTIGSLFKGMPNT
jgi:hypothetical protein